MVKAKLQSKQQEHDRFRERSTYVSNAVRFLVYGLLIVICFAIVFGVFKAGYDLFTNLFKPIEALLPQILIDTVFIVALIEISLLLLGYLREGHVHVRYIVDTILIIMLNEFVVIWFDHGDNQKLLVLCAIVATLAAVRVGIVRFTTPADRKDA